MIRKAVVIVIFMCIVITICIGFRNIHYYYDKNSEEFLQAKLYLKSDVCQNPELSKKLGNFARCEDSKRILRISPWTKAWYNFLEDMYICGHGRCDTLWGEISTKLPYITLFTGSVMLWVAYQWVQTQRMQNAAMYWQLPLQMHPRQVLNQQHSHID